MEKIEAVNTNELSRSIMAVTILKVLSPSLFWVRYKHWDRQFEELIEDLNFYMERKKDRLVFFPMSLKKGSLVAITTNKGWQRGVVSNFNGDATVQVFLRDWGTFVRRSIMRLYILEDQFRKLPWQAIPCGLAYAEPLTQGSPWSREAREIVKLLENREGWTRIIKPINEEGAMMHLEIQHQAGEGSKELVATLDHLGYIRRSSTPSSFTFPTIEEE